MHRSLQLAAVAACACLLLGGCGTPTVEGGSGGSAVGVREVADPAAAGPRSGPGAPTAGEAQAVDERPAPVAVPPCTSPVGYSVAPPEGWSVNPGTVLPECSWFDPEPFTVPEGTDVRTAITIRVETGPAPAAWPDERSRTTVEVDGRPAHRVEQVTTAGLYPVGTPITTYVVDLGNGRVLLADTVGLAAADHERNVRVLDEMMRSLELPGGPTV